MINLLSKTFKTVKRDGFIAAVKKAKNRIKSKQQLRRIDFSAEENKWFSLKDCYKGKRVFLIGNGPSLNKTPLYLLKDEYKMCFNRFHIMTERLNWTPDFFMTSDNLVLSDLITELDQIIPQSRLSFFPGIHFRGYNYIDQIEKFENAYWTVQMHGRGFSERMPEIYPGGSVIYEGFQVLKYLGFSEVYLIGVDMNYQIHKTAKQLQKKGIDIISQDDDDPNHFDPRYFGKNRKYHQPEKFVIDNTIKDLDYLAKNFVNKDFQIINAGLDSKLRVFPKKELYSILNISKEEQRAIFFTMVEDMAKQQNETLPFKNWIFINTEDGQSIKVDISFICEEHLALSMIKQLIFTHIPLGPFDNNYYFIKRKES